MISVCITVVNEPVLSRKCIDSVQRNTPAPFEIIVCDNGSTDPATIDYLDALACSGEIVLERNAQNTGCGPGWNAEMRKVLPDTDYVVILHNDAEVVPDWVPTMQAPILEGKADFVASERCGDRPDNRFVAGVIDNERQIAAGPVYMFTKSSLDVAGLLDEQFVPIYFDDADWMMRFRLCGFNMYVTLDVKFPHVEFTTTTKGRSPHEVGDIVGRNQARLARKWEGTFLYYIPGWDAIRMPADKFTWVHKDGKTFMKIDRHKQEIVAEEECVAPYRVPDDICMQCNNQHCWKKTLPVDELAFVQQHGLPLFPDYPVNQRFWE